MLHLEEEWESFLVCDDFTGEREKEVADKNIPKCPEGSSLRISTKVKILYLDIKDIDICGLYWKLPITQYWEQREGIIKKQIKYTCLTKESYNELMEKKKHEPLLTIDEIKHYEREIEEKELSDDEDGEKKPLCIFKNVSKLTIGLCNKDIKNRRIKKKGAFYNCFMLVLRISVDGVYKEISIKLFNTGKVSFPGMLTDFDIKRSLEIITNTMKNIMNKPVNPIKKSLETVLINSNFNCGFYLNRDKLFNILKFKYKLHTTYDQCSYPGIQCKFFDNVINKERNGYCVCKKGCLRKGNGLWEGNCREISFMIFRTGSVLIVGKGEEELLIYIYNFIKKILIENYSELYEGLNNVKKETILNKKQKKKHFYINI